MRTVRELKRDVSGHLAAATDDAPVIIRKYTSPYRAIVPFELWERALEALREKEARDGEVSDQEKQETAA